MIIWRPLQKMCGGPVKSWFSPLLPFCSGKFWPQELKSQRSTVLLNKERHAVINLCLWNILNTLGSNYCCAYSPSYINICTCKNSAPWHLLKWLHGGMRQIDSETGVGSQHEGRQSFVNASTTSGGKKYAEARTSCKVARKMPCPLQLLRDLNIHLGLLVLHSRAAPPR